MLLWHFPLRRLDAEPVWDSVMSAAGELDPAVGGPSFDVGGGARRRAAYMVRGYSTSRDVTPTFLQAFDVEDGRAPCPVRNQTVTAPQALFMMNSPQVENASAQFAKRVAAEAKGDLKTTTDLAFRYALGRPPTDAEAARAAEYLASDATRMKGLAWLLFNLDEFLYVK